MLHTLSKSGFEMLLNSARRRLPQGRTATSSEVQKAITAAIRGASFKPTETQAKEARTRISAELGRRGGDAAARLRTDA
jgi:hypothetical protein